jgi:hypothetical protein
MFGDGRHVVSFQEVPAENRARHMPSAYCLYPFRGFASRFKKLLNRPPEAKAAA